MKFVFFVLFAFATCDFHAQDDGVIGAGLFNLTSNSSYTSGSWVRNFEDTTIEGSVYLFEDWDTKGIIINADGKNLSISGLNYDTKNDAILAKISNDSVYMFNNANIKEVIINKKRLKRYRDNRNQTSYMQVLAMNNNIEILKKNEKKIKKGLKDPLTQVKERDRYLNVYRMYFKKGNTIKEFKLKNKTFSKLFGIHAKEISDYMSKMKISVKDETKLQMVLNYYGTL